MREVRLSIPFVGGITVVYTKEEIDAKKAKLSVQAGKVKQSFNKTVGRAKEYSNAVVQAVKDVHAKKGG